MQQKTFGINKIIQNNCSWGQINILTPWHLSMANNWWIYYAFLSCCLNKTQHSNWDRYCNKIYGIKSREILQQNIRQSNWERFCNAKNNNWIERDERYCIYLLDEKEIIVCLFLSWCCLNKAQQTNWEIYCIKKYDYQIERVSLLLWSTWHDRTILESLITLKANRRRVRLTACRNI